MSAIVSYRIAEVKPLYPTEQASDEFPRRMLGRILNAQDVVNLGGHFEGKDKAMFFHLGITWMLSLEIDPVGDEWNALPHGRDEGAYDTDIQVDRRVMRRFIP